MMIESLKILFEDSSTDMISIETFWLGDNC